MKTLIIGRGEVGRALDVVLAQYCPDMIDAGEKCHGTFDILHVCFPFSDEFVAAVESYRRLYQPKWVVIHSTVPVGTSRKCDAIHSPIRGVHPNLVEGIRTFQKFMGGPDASKVSDYFRRAGLRVMLFDKSETTEASKLFETEHYRSCIEFVKRCKSYCDEHGLSFHEVYTLQAITYNEGYAALGYPEYVRPVLQAIGGPIGGHCVSANKALLET